MNFGIIIIGDEILSGKRADKHLPKAIELLGNRGLQVAYAHYLADDPQRITASLAEAFGSGDVVFSFGGIGATPDDHTRQCAAAAIGRPLQLHPGARTLILERMRDIALQNGHAFDPDREDNVHRLEMGRFPEGASLIPNPYNKIAGFSCQGQGDGAVLIGVAPGQFVAMVAIMQLSENLQHANLRLWFGRVGERLWVSPRFHRMHHAIGIGHESPATGPTGSPPVLGGCNFGVLLPWWDMLFGTANFTLAYPATGVRDQVEQGVDYGRGFWSQQWRGVLRLVGRA